MAEVDNKLMNVTVYDEKIVVIISEGFLFEHNLLSSAHPNTLPASLIPGDIFFVNATSKATRLPKGIDGQIVKQVAGFPAWGNEAGAGSGGAPVDATYVVLSAHVDLTQERILTAGAGISITDGGAGAIVTIASTITQYTDALAKVACVSDAVYGVGWNGVTNVAPSKNAVYDKIESLEVGLWTDAGTYIYPLNITDSVQRIYDIATYYTFTSGVQHKTSLLVDNTAMNGAGDQTTAMIMATATQTIGYGNGYNKVGLMVGMKGASGCKSDIWALNPLIQFDSGWLGAGGMCIEADVNNNKGASTAISGITVTGAGAYQCGAAYRAAIWAGNSQYWEWAFYGSECNTGLFINQRAASAGAIIRIFHDMAGRMELNSVGDLWISGTFSQGGVGLWADAGTYIYSNNTSNIFRIYDTTGSLSLIGQDVVTNVANHIKPVAVGGRNYAVAVELDEAGVTTGDKVTLYCATRGSAGSSDIWALNTLLQMDAGWSGTHAICVEVDVNNSKAHNIGQGISVVGIGTYNPWSAFSCGYSGGGIWQRGISLSQVNVGIEVIQATGATGVLMQLYSSGPTIKAYIENNGNMWIAGKLTQAGCPMPITKEWSLDVLRDELSEGKEYHNTGEMVMAMAYLLNEILDQQNYN